MIRILYMSDLHLEMERWRLNVLGWATFMARHRGIARHPARGPMLDEVGKIDLVLLAGDIHNGFRGVVYADQVAQYLAAPVVMIAGNHEFYHHDTTILLPALREAAAKTQGRVQFLENTLAAFCLAGRRINILGCTLWTDYSLHGDTQAAMQTATARMNDHVLIKSHGMAFTPADALARHDVSRRWLAATLLMQGPDVSNIILTHHAPDGALLGTRTGEIAPAYCSDLLAKFASSHPLAWVHGHTHYRHETMIHGIKVLSAPRGYVAFDGAEALQFTPGIMAID